MHCVFGVGCLLVTGVSLVWFRMGMNYGSQPIFKPYEMLAAFHPERSVRLATPQQCREMTLHSTVGC